ncbi:MAG: helix-turn-helix domain-containing protein [Clostridia bacterium]|nr:helix-turn-helix domain-containing protein [Clostridia bacterium]
MGDKLYTPQDVADMFGVKRITVWDWIRKGKLRAHCIGGRLYRISEKQIDKFKESGNVR